MLMLLGVGKAAGNSTLSPNGPGRDKLSEPATSAGPAGAGAEAGPCARSRERLHQRAVRSEATRGERPGAGGL